MYEIIYLGTVFVQEIGTPLCGEELSMLLKEILIWICAF